jgi:hypothetical protein
MPGRLWRFPCASQFGSGKQIKRYLIENIGAGEGNRTLVITLEDFRGLLILLNKW